MASVAFGGDAAFGGGFTFGAVSPTKSLPVQAAASPGDLVRWVQKRFLPFVRERLPECMLSPLLTAACDWGGQLQMTPASLGAAAATPGTGCGAGGGGSVGGGKGGGSEGTSDAGFNDF